MTNTPPPSTPNPVPAVGEADQLQARLEAERDGTAYWRAVAQQRRVEAARVQKRPLVRAAIAVDRRTARAQSALQTGLRRMTSSAGRASLRAQVLLRRPQLVARRDRVDSVVDEAARSPAPADDRTITVLHLGAAPAGPRRAGLHIVPVAVADLDAAVGSTVSDLVCLVGPWTTVLTVDWLDRLAQPLRGEVVATVPQVIHARRPPPSATPLDLLVQSVGYGVEAGPDGSPRLIALGAGDAPDPSRANRDVVGGGVASLLLERRRWIEAGGLGAVADPTDPIALDAAVVDLCLRLTAPGGVVRTAPACLVSDDRPVHSADQLTAPLPDPVWTTVVEDHGAAVLASTPGARPTASVVITTATPSPKIAPRSGDWHFAQRLAVAFERAGRSARVHTIDRADSTAGRVADLHLVLRGLEPVRRTRGQRHVLWVISHPEALDAAECDEADLVVVASSRYADHLRTLTDTPVEVLLQATDADHFRPMPVEPRHHHAVTVVANTRGAERRVVSDALAAGLRPAVYGMGWESGPTAALVEADYVGFDTLPSVYSSAGVVLNDHWATMRRWGFVSNRIFDVAACGTPVISDHLPEIQALFGDLVATWRTPHELATAVAAIEADPESALARAEATRQLVLDHHTFDHRVAELDHLLAKHGLTGRTSDR